jgi:hypothetical protein
VKAEVAKREEEMSILREQIDEEQVRKAKLTALLSQYNHSGTNSITGISTTTTSTNTGGRNSNHARSTSSVAIATASTSSGTRSNSSRIRPRPNSDVYSTSSSSRYSEEKSGGRSRY